MLFFFLCRFAVTRNETEGEGPSVDGAGETQELLSSQTSEGERSKTKGEHARRLGCVSETLISFCGPLQRLGNFQRGLALSGWQNIFSLTFDQKQKKKGKCFYGCIMYQCLRLRFDVHELLHRLSGFMDLKSLKKVKIVHN